uniref:Uncharacterized protein n=1 Tax=Physcomitrium patens TaxID=3218 RepID=A0A2K1JT60_PHYPA|nr:hypothetical protein PHYPA_014494 [Physcomitrium patens]
MEKIGLRRKVTCFDDLLPCIANASPYFGVGGFFYGL